MNSMSAPHLDITTFAAKGSAYHLRAKGFRFNELGYVHERQVLLWSIEHVLITYGYAHIDFFQGIEYWPKHWLT